jgi:hypothetical protein
MIPRVKRAGLVGPSTPVTAMPRQPRRAGGELDLPDSASIAEPRIQDRRFAHIHAGPTAMIAAHGRLKHSAVAAARRGACAGGEQFLLSCHLGPSYPLAEKQL